jgi:hypothetical protein
MTAGGSCVPGAGTYWPPSVSRRRILTATQPEVVAASGDIMMTMAAVYREGAGVSTR